MKSWPSVRSVSLRHRAGGFTLIELIVTVTILVILTTLALPSFQSAYLSNRLASYANGFVASVQFARTEAIKRNSAVTLCRSADAATCASTGTWQQGWIVMCNATTLDPTICSSAGTNVLVLQKSDPVSSSYSFTTTSTGSPYSLVFPGSGVGTTTATVKICRSSPSAGNQERTIDITTTGRTTVTKTTTGTCP